MEVGRLNSAILELLLPAAAPKEQEPVMKTTTTTMSNLLQANMPWPEKRRIHASPLSFIFLFQSTEVIHTSAFP